MPNDPSGKPCDEPDDDTIIDDLDLLTDEELRERAEDEGVDLTGVKDRAGIIEAIRLSAEH